MENFELPLALGLLHHEEEHPTIGTDLREINEWEHFDEWVGETLDMIRDEQFWNLELPCSIPHDLVISIGDRADLQDALAGIMLRLASLPLQALYGSQTGFARGEDIMGSVGHFDFAAVRNQTPIVVIQALLPGHEHSIGLDKAMVNEQYIHKIYAQMLFNGTNYGIITTYRNTWFVRLTASGIEVSEAVKFNQHTGHTTVGAIVATVIRAWSQPRQWPWLPFRQERQSSQLGGWAEIMLGNGYRNEDGLYICIGRYRHHGSPSWEEGCVIKCVDSSRSRAQSLHWEAELYKRINHESSAKKHRPYPLNFPTMIAYGEVWNCLSVLILKSAGRPLNLHDFGAISNLPHKIMGPVKALHHLNFVHNDIRLCNFVIDEGKVSLVSLGHCVFTGSVSKKLNELNKVDRLVRFHRQKLLGSRKVKAWRQNMHRRLYSGWHRYQHKYVRVTLNNSIKAIRLSL